MELMGGALSLCGGAVSGKKKGFEEEEKGLGGEPVEVTQHLNSLVMIRTPVAVWRQITAAVEELRRERQLG